MIRIATITLIGILIASPVQAQESAADQAKVATAGFVEQVTAVTEPFRIKYAQELTAKRDAVKARIGIQVSKQVGSAVQERVEKALLPDAAPGTKAAQSDIPESADTQQFGTLDNPWDYVTLFWTSALAAMFNNKLVFYVSAVLLILIVLRFIITRFARSSSEA